MNEPQLTKSEKRYLEDLRNLPTSMRSRILGWTMELAPSIGLFVYGLAADRRLFLVLGFISLLYFAVLRMYSQFRGSGMIHSVYVKQLAAKEEGMPPKAMRADDPSGRR
tara:strand:- start:15587 stop:15913 length:327 start_codon:yes stop_codon:yes gene_type:complete